MKRVGAGQPGGGRRTATTVRDFLICAAAIVVTIAILTTSSCARKIDNVVFDYARSLETTVLDDSVFLIDLARGRQSDDELLDYRRRLADVLTRLHQQADIPAVIVLDIWFASSDVGLDALTAAIRALQLRGARVYASVNLLNRHGQVNADFAAEHNTTLYESVLDGYGHSLLENRNGLLSYRAAIQLPTAPGTPSRVVPALPVIAAFGTVHPVQAEQRITFPYRSAVDSWQTLKVGMQHADTRSIADAPWAQVKHLVVGSFAADRDNVVGIAGPILVAYAISERLSTTSIGPLNSVGSTALVVALALLTAALVFVAGFRKIRRSRPPSEWSRHALIYGIAASAMAVLVVAVLFQLLWTTGRIIPVANAIAGAFALSAALCFIARQRQSDALAQLDINTAVDESARQYDVFISYAHEPDENMQWVREQVFAPLAALRRPDGQPLRIFFDENSIRPGRQWKREIELALLGTRSFVPVFSESYFDRAYCREELELADQLRIESRLSIIPIARTHDIIPERYRRKLQYIDANKSDFFARLAGQLLPTTDPEPGQSA